MFKRIFKKKNILGYTVTNQGKIKGREDRIMNCELESMDNTEGDKQAGTKCITERKPSRTK